mgnify:CR=1 FL=1
MRRNASKDANQDELMEMMRLYGLSVYNIRQPVDLVVASSVTRFACMVEVKNPQQKRRDRRLTRIQMGFFNGWAGYFVVLQALEEAIALASVLNFPAEEFERYKLNSGGSHAAAEYCNDEMIAYFQDVYGGVPLEQLTGWRWHQYNGFCESGRAQAA